MVLSDERQAHAGDDPCDDWSNDVHNIPTTTRKRSNDDRKNDDRSDRPESKHDGSVVSYDILRVLRGR